MMGNSWNVDGEVPGEVPGIDHLTVDVGLAKEVPELDEGDYIPEDCEYGKCPDDTAFVIRFQDPADAVYYCHDHTKEQLDDNNIEAIHPL